MGIFNRNKESKPPESKTQPVGFIPGRPEEEKYLNSKNELKAMVTGLLAGRAAEELIFGDVTTGASNDIERATDLARKMVTMYGMSDKFGVMGLSTVESQYLENRQVLNCSDVTAAAVDEEVRKILNECYEEAKKILSENLDVLDQIAAVLIRQETITGKEFMRIYREAKGLPAQEDKTKEEKELEALRSGQQSAQEHQAEDDLSVSGQEDAEAAGNDVMPSAAEPHYVDVPYVPDNEPESGAAGVGAADAGPQEGSAQDHAPQDAGTSQTGMRGRFSGAPLDRE